jgi:hypothetical protein
MITVNELIEVVFASVFWGGWMLFVSTRERKNSGFKTAVSPSLVSTWAFGGLFFGLLTTLGWRRAFSFPMVFATVGVLSAALLTAKILGRARVDQGAADADIPRPN